MPAPVQPESTGELCQISDFKMQLMKAVSRRYPKSKYTFSLNDFKIEGEEGDRLKIRMYSEGSSKTLQRFLSRCRIKNNGNEKWIHVFKTDPAKI